jgi:8-oxo-dGTP diphosphatase
MNSLRRREVSSAIVIDRSGHFLLQQRDNKADILYPGMVGLFGGHREGDETFLQCVARELCEELSYVISPERFEHLWSYDGDNWEKDGHLCAEFFVVRDVPIEEVRVTEGTLLVVDSSDLAGLSSKLAPGANMALARYMRNQSNCE